MRDSFSSHTDEELLTAIAWQDHDAFAELVRRYSSKLYSTAYRILINRTDAEDIVQDTFLKLWKNPQIWNERYNNRFSTFFYKVVTNRCIDHIRKNSYRHHQELSDIHTSSFSTVKIMESKSKSELINKFIKDLPERQQIALNLCYYENLTSHQVAEIMDISPKGVQSLVLRAKQSLKSKLKKYYETEAI